MLKKICSILLVILMLMPAAYGADSKLSSIRINGGQKIYMEKGDTFKVPITTKPYDADISDIKYSTSNSNIITVDKNGYITARKVGTARITARIGKISGSVSVQVTESSALKVNFSESDIEDNKAVRISMSIRESSINADREDDDEENLESPQFTIYLPSGYFVSGTTAQFDTDRNGNYPFTVYRSDTKQKKTFYYEVDSIGKKTDDTDDAEEIPCSSTLNYDYDKKSYILTLTTNKIRSFSVPSGSKQDTNIYNYYLPSMNNDTIYDYTVTVDDSEFRYQIMRKGETILLIEVEDPNDNGSNFVHSYRAYNFASPGTYVCTPQKNFIDANGDYEIFVTSAGSKSDLFTISVDYIDYQRPYMEYEFDSSGRIVLDIYDNYRLDHMISYDGKYTKISGNTKHYKYTSPEITYNGEYLFTAADTNGNLSSITVRVTDEDDPEYTAIGISAHRNDSAEFLLKDKGSYYEYKDEDDDEILEFESIFMPYMSSTTDSTFSPNASVTRAQLAVILCHLNDLPYDINLIQKSKLTDIDDHWAKTYITMAEKSKLMSGYRDKTFRPDEYVTRSEFCEILYKIKSIKSKIDSMPAVMNNNFTDITENAATIIKLSNRGIFNTDGINFYPDTRLTRAELCHAVNMINGLNPTPAESRYMENLFTQYYNFTDIYSSPYKMDIIISIVGMYRETKSSQE